MLRAGQGCRTTQMVRGNTPLSKTVILARAERCNYPQTYANKPSYPRGTTPPSFGEIPPRAFGEIPPIPIDRVL